jgi:hypothetical protein
MAAACAADEERAMTVRTTETTVTFRRPFTLSAFAGAQPAGTYRLVMEDEDIPDLTFLAYRRTATMLHVPAISNSTGSEEVYFINSAELSAAMKADAQNEP